MELEELQERLDYAVEYCANRNWFVIGIINDPVFHRDPDGGNLEFLCVCFADHNVIEGGDEVALLDNDDTISFVSMEAFTYGLQYSDFPKIRIFESPVIAVNEEFEDVWNYYYELRDKIARNKLPDLIGTASTMFYTAEDFDDKRIACYGLYAVINILKGKTMDEAFNLSETELNEQFIKDHGDEVMEWAEKFYSLSQDALWINPDYKESEQMCHNIWSLSKESNIEAIAEEQNE